MDGHIPGGRPLRQNSSPSGWSIPAQSRRTVIAWRRHCQLPVALHFGPTSLAVASSASWVGSWPHQPSMTPLSGPPSCTTPWPGGRRRRRGCSRPSSWPFEPRPSWTWAGRRQPAPSLPVLCAAMTTGERFYELEVHRLLGPHFSKPSLLGRACLVVRVVCRRGVRPAARRCGSTRSPLS